MLYLPRIEQDVHYPHTLTGMPYSPLGAVDGLRSRALSWDLRPDLARKWG
jgi:hypothetical protein